MSTAASPLPIEGFDSRFAEVNGVRLHYWIGGDPEGQPVVLWHGFLSTGYAWRDVAPALADAGFAVLAADMRGYGDSDKPPGVEGYDARALAEEARALVAQIGFGHGRSVVHAAHDMGALPALLWTADHPDEVKALLYIEGPVMLGEVLRPVFAYTRESMAQGSMWWILPLGPGVPERLIVGTSVPSSAGSTRATTSSITTRFRPPWWTSICAPSPVAKACSAASASIAPPLPASPRPSRC